MWQLCAHGAASCKCQPGALSSSARVQTSDFSTNEGHKVTHPVQDLDYAPTSAPAPFSTNDCHNRFGIQQATPPHTTAQGTHPVQELVYAPDVSSCCDGVGKINPLDEPVCVFGIGLGCYCISVRTAATARNFNTTWQLPQMPSPQTAAQIQILAHPHCCHSGRTRGGSRHHAAGSGTPWDLWARVAVVRGAPTRV